MLTRTRIDETAERAGTELGARAPLAVTRAAVDAVVTGGHRRSLTDPGRVADSPLGAERRERRPPHPRAEVI